MNLADLHNLAQIEAAAKSRLAPSTLSYYDGGANDELTVAANRASYAKLSLLPRVMVDISEIDLTTSVLGTPLKLPIGIAPSALHGLAHPDAECATARAAASMGSLMALSTLSNSTIEEVGEAAPGKWWFQLYLYRDREVSRALVQRAEAAGAGALVLTVDAAYLGRRERLLRLPMVVPEQLALPNIGAQHPQPLQYFVSLLDTSLNWKDLAWLRGLTDLPIVLKGILTPQDADLAAEHGCHVWVSNHGGRQLDTAVTALEMLPEISAALAGRCELYLDGGITRGTDVLKALALGANAVFLGRAALWGLAVAGEIGVVHTLKLLEDELRLAMALCGKTSLAQLGPELVRAGG
ncbi:alpha-hydroxy-acid oxidizing protein (plasmid) [Deinococcus psychrotolerans]|uniref:Alpha-hydroxy-acid oxidizing protein n=1 Tax=Deinococcus psychrotolerans TaxID=2489213 RepID=A0A3G8YHY4_9DEIO|nr:alpha-hydroxy acid oxidase [Deinococcus psychrotolerans]AZI44460.1 alpha-hydroxy-acid oxidizing protein [Deinococcus psychrotolerans]